MFEFSPLGYGCTVYIEMQDFILQWKNNWGSEINRKCGEMEQGNTVQPAGTKTGESLLKVFAPIGDVH